jgi:hypothetical protein
MKLRIDNYLFDKNAKTITFTDYASVDISGILLITNVVDNIIIYNFANNLLGGTVVNNVLTLTYNTSGMSNTDSLQIFYDDGNSAALAALQLTLNTMLDNDNALARQILQLLRPLGVTVGGTGRLSLDVFSIGTLPTLTNVTTVGTVTNLGASATLATLTNQTNIGGLNALDQQFNIAHIAFNTLRNLV